MTLPLLAPRTDRGRGTVLALSAVALVAAFCVALCVGARAVPLGDLWPALTGQASPEVVTAVRDVRLPRTVVALVAGAALGVSGALVQALTRNPLADPGILGLNAGASMTIALTVVVTGTSALALQLPFAFLGSLAVAVAIMLIGGPTTDRAGIARVTLAGVAIGAVLSGIITALTLVDPAAYSVLNAWNAASVEGKSWSVLLPVLPFVVVGLVVAIVLGPALDALALGEDLARGLGADVGKVRAAVLVAASLLAASATAMAGPISFVGLMVPHVARRLMGVRHRWVVVVTLLLAPVLVLLADVVGRIALPNGEIPVGLVTAFVGAPVLIALACRRRLVGL